MANGKPINIASTCTALNPPTCNNTKVIIHVTMAQNILSQRGARLF